MITIHYDFTDGTEVSYMEGLFLKDNFTTNCLDFFNNDVDVDDVVIIDKKGNRLSRRLLMTKGDISYTNKDMSEAHNIQKMLKAKSFNWQKDLEPEKVDKEFIRKYIKDNLRVDMHITDKSGHRGDQYKQINVEIILEGETISETCDFL